MTRLASPVAHQFDDLAQQHRAGTLGMWTFLASEVLLFGGLFISYTTMRVLHHDGFVVGSHHMSFVIGSINTAILLTSSLMMALAVYSADARERKATVWFLVATIVLGVIFVVLKGYEYYQHFEEGLMPGPHFTFAGPHAREVGLFFWLYYIMTGLHALHMLIGIGVLGVLALMTATGRFMENPKTIGNAGLYWHYIDVVWVFLYALFYLVGSR